MDAVAFGVDFILKPVVLVEPIILCSSVNGSTNITQCLGIWVYGFDSSDTVQLANLHDSMALVGNGIQFV